MKFIWNLIWKLETHLATMCLCQSGSIKAEKKKTGIKVLFLVELTVLRITFMPMGVFHQRLHPRLHTGGADILLTVNQVHTWIGCVDSINDICLFAFKLRYLCYCIRTFSWFEKCHVFLKCIAKSERYGSLDNHVRGVTFRSGRFSVRECMSIAPESIVITALSPPVRVRVRPITLGR